MCDLYIDLHFPMFISQYLALSHCTEQLVIHSYRKIHCILSFKSSFDTWVIVDTIDSAHEIHLAILGCPEG